MIAKRIFAGILVSVVTALSLLGCTDAAPKSCIDLARENDKIPDRVVEWMEKPGDLNALERVAVREALELLGADDVCDEIKKQVE